VFSFCFRSSNLHRRRRHFEGGSFSLPPARRAHKPNRGIPEPLSPASRPSRAPYPAPERPDLDRKARDARDCFGVWRRGEGEGGEANDLHTSLVVVLLLF
jgi:hypothetical protein